MSTTSDDDDMLRALDEEDAAGLMDGWNCSAILDVVASEEAGFATDLWNTVLELGIDRVLVKEDNGGMQGTWRDAYPVVRASGEYALVQYDSTHLPMWPLVRASFCSLRQSQPGRPCRTIVSLIHHIAHLNLDKQRSVGP